MDKIEYFNYVTDIKLQKIVTENSNITITDYAGNYIYENDQLQFFNHAEGYTTPDGSGGYDYVYSYLDHLGNVRLNYSDLDNNGSISISEIIQENNYYPMGLKHKGYNNNILFEHKWKYNGKELQDELDLNWYDLGARNLDHALGRFMNVDPRSEQYNFQSPYAFANNNPVFFIDINGEGVDDWIVVDNNGYFTGEIIKDEKTHGIQITNDDGSFERYAFNDQVNDIKFIYENINSQQKFYGSTDVEKIVNFVSDEYVSNLQKETMSGGESMWGARHIYAWAQSLGGRMDAVQTLFPDFTQGGMSDIHRNEVNNGEYPDDVNFFIHVGNRNKKAYNFHDFGNYNWGGAMYELGFKSLKYILSKAQGNENGNDSNADQQAIKYGYLNAKNR